MKTVTYTLSNKDVESFKKSVFKQIEKSLSEFNKNPDQFYTKDLSKLKKQWFKSAIAKASFDLFVVDGLATIEKHEDNFYTFTDHAGDCYCPITNGDIDPKELRRQEKNERARFNRQGCFYIVLNVLGNELDSIGGFVGNDFYGSGYDDDFYSIAWDYLRDNEQTKEYIAELTDYILFLTENYSE